MRQALRTGIARVLGATTLLNRINVYPVADGDTGTNLALTLGTVDRALVAAPDGGAGETLARVADAALDGARGNSGAIMAELFQGMADAAGDRAEIDPTVLALAFATADRFARGAIDAPQEGTILTAISAVARALGAGPQDGLGARLEAAVQAGREAVAETRRLLPAMRRAGVEDAGARGFLLFLEGFADALLGRAALPAAEPARAPEAGIEAPMSVEAVGRFRFCTECIVIGANIDRRRLHDALGALGDSLVLAGNRERVKVHIHTDEPAAVFERVRGFGTLAAEKADDMERQARSRADSGAGIAVVTDSGADLPEEICEQYGIHMVPLRIHFDDRTFLDKVSLSPAEFLDEVARQSGHPRTSQPAPGDLRRVYEFLASHHAHVVAVSVAARVSGTWQAAQTAARRSATPERITVIDSRNVSTGQGLITLYAAECARAGLRPEALLEAVRGAVGRTRTFGMVTDLGYAVRGGRLPRALQSLSRWLPLRPVLTMGGGTVRLGGAILRGADPVAALARYALGSRVPGQRHRFAIAHAGLPAEAKALAALLAARERTHAGIFVSELGAAVSVHGGPGTLAVAVQEYRPPEEP